MAVFKHFLSETETLAHIISGIRHTKVFFNGVLVLLPQLILYDQNIAILEIVQSCLSYHSSQEQINLYHELMTAVTMQIGSLLHQWGQSLNLCVEKIRED
jgi:hypothetical protein